MSNERDPLLQSNNDFLFPDEHSSNSSSSNNSNHEFQIDENIIRAKNDLLFSLVVIISSSLLISLLAVIDSFLNGDIPLWVYFFLLQLGCMLLFIIIFRIIWSLIIALIKDKPSSPIEIENYEKQIPLVLYLGAHVITLLGTTVLLFIEIFVLYFALGTGDNSSTPMISIYMIPYITLGSLILYSLFFRFSSWLNVATWLLLLTQTILLTLKTCNTTYDYSASLTWLAVLSPALATIALWLLVFFIIAVKAIMKTVHLKLYQENALGLYTASLVLGLGSLISIALYADSLSDTHTYIEVDSDSKSIEITLLECGVIFFLLGLSLFGLGVYRVAYESIAVVLSRTGGSRPQPLVKLRQGGWTVDESQAFEVYPLLGEIDTTTTSSTSSNNNTIITSNPMNILINGSSNNSSSGLS